MNAERWARIKELFGEALERDSSEWEGYLATKCNDQAMRAEVLVLLRKATDDAPLVPPEVSQSVQDLASQTIASSGILLKDRYRIREKIGEGGFARVFLADDTLLDNRKVVVKILRQALEDDKTWLTSRFDAEIKALARLDHPGVVAVLDTGMTNNGDQFLVMQYVEGTTLRSMLHEGPLPFATVADLIRQVSTAVEAAHGKEIVHQDIKPENIMVENRADGSNRVRLIDFGIAKLLSQDLSTGGSKIAGSISYMAPEQLKGHPSASSDIYALGVLAYELLTRVKPFRSSQSIDPYDELLHRRHFPKPSERRSQIPPDADRVIMKALEYQEADRYQSAEVFAADLWSALEYIEEGSSDTRRPLGNTGVFVSYASRNTDFAGIIIAECEKRGIPCFDGIRDLFLRASGDEQQTIAEAGCLLLILTDDANRSARVIDQVKTAALVGVPIVVLATERTKLAGLLAFAIPQARSVNTSISPTPAQLAELDKAIRQRVQIAVGNPVPKRMSVAASQDPRASLLTECTWRPFSVLLNGDHLTMIAATVLWALVTCCLAQLGSAGDIIINLASGGPSRPDFHIHFGYLYELNCALTYLVVAPAFLFCVLQFVQQTQVALIALAGRDQLTIVPAAGAKEGFTTPLAWVGAANRRWMQPGLLALVAAITILIMVGSEYLPPKSDYKTVMFGYVQAPWIADYPLQCPDCSLQELSRVTGRQLESIDGISDDDLKKLTIAKEYYRRSGSIVEQVAFVFFMMNALALEVAFGFTVVWTLLKVVFVLRMLYLSISRPGYPLRLHLNFADPKRMFGLEPVHRLLTRIVGLIGISLALEVLSWWTNFLKGSKRVLAADLLRLSGWGQFLVTNYLIVLAAALLVYLFVLSSKARDLAVAECGRVDKLGHRIASSDVDEQIQIIERQGVWTNPYFSLVYVLVPVLYLASLTASQQVGIARAIGKIWDVFLQHILGRA